MTTVSSAKVREIAQSFGLFDDKEDRRNIATNKNNDFILDDDKRLVNCGNGYKGLEKLQEHLMLFADIKDLQASKTIDILIDTRRSVIDYCREHGLQIGDKLWKSAKLIMEKAS